MMRDTKPSADDLLASLREMPSPSAMDSTLKSRIHARLAVSLVGLAPVASAGSAAPLGGKSAVVHATSVGSKSVILAWLTPVFVAGTIGSVATVYWYTATHATHGTHAAPSGTAVHQLGVPSAALEAAAPPVRDPLVEELEPVHEVVVAKATTHAPAASVEPGDSMAQERELLDAARTALARGEPGVGIASLEKHVKRFPKGTLAEEREALFVRILFAMGNDVAAQSRAEDFKRRFPNSIFMPVVERALASISRRNAENVPKP